MDFYFRQVDTLPKLAWCARIDCDQSLVTVLHGRDVATRDSFFVEGAWNGPFEQGQFYNATVMMGSGGVSNKSSVTFVSPTHCLERLHLSRHRDKLYVSNSLAFVLTQTNDSCDPSYLFYIHDLVHFDRKSHQALTTAIPTQKGNKVHLYQSANLVIQQDLTITASRKSPTPTPNNYEQYQNLLQQALQQLNDNATSPQRPVKYDLSTTVSSGYDSPVCAAIASRIGCQQALTFAKSQKNTKWSDDDDSGEQIAELLGMKTIVFDRNQYLDLPDHPEAEFLACGTGEDVVLASMQQSLHDKLLLTGMLGDTVWSMHTHHDHTLSIAGATLAEFRLRVGFIHVPLPCIGAEHQKAIRKITNSSEMKTWSIGGGYDRPIPRRIVEEQGVPRDMFGQEKRAVVTCPAWNPREQTEASSQAFEEYVLSARRPTPMIARWKFQAIKACYHMNIAVNNTLSRLAKCFGKKLNLSPLLSQKYKQFPGKRHLLFHWGQSVIQQRYQVHQSDELLASPEESQINTTPQAVATASP